jgi:hypothetical protein
MGRSLAVVPYYARMGKGRIILKSKLDALGGLPRMLRKRGRVVRKVHDGEIEKLIYTWARIPSNSMRFLEYRGMIRIMTIS